MLNKDLVNPKNTAILVIDIQNDYCSEKGKIAKFRKRDVRPIQRIVPKLIKFIEIARKANTPIIFTRMIEDPKHMNENAKIKFRTAKVPLALCSPKTWGFEYYKIKP